MTLQDTSPALNRGAQSSTRLHHRIAIAAAVAAAAAIMIDTVVLAVTGARTMITDDTAAPLVITVIVGLVLGATFASIAAVVRAEAARFRAGNRLLHFTYRPLLVGLIALAIGIGLVHPVELIVGVDPESVWASTSAMIAFAVLIMTQLSATLAGLATLGRNPLGWGGRILRLVLPTVAATALLALVRPDMADPAFVSVITLLGLAFVGVGARIPAEG